MTTGLFIFLLSAFQETDTRKETLGCLRVHVLVWYVHFLILELAFTTIAITIYALFARPFSWPTIASVTILSVLLLTLLFGVYALYSQKPRYLRLFSVRTKLIYFSVFVWAIANYFVQKTFIAFLMSVLWTIGGLIYVFEDNAIITTIDFVRYRYRGLDDKDES
ncbi:hypothetical protein M3Y96_00356500 [Aphelenchoides besseyi]|nr:hypothetical protein M3Y96_00356500 [Aphelenchoides besseyi]